MFSPLDVKSYVAPTWLLGGNAQTIYPFLLGSSSIVSYRRERWELNDGDFIDIDWLDNVAEAPMVVLFHGLEGNSYSHYAQSIMSMLRDFGWRGAVVHFRGCSGSPNRLARAYHAGDSVEIDWVLRKIIKQNALRNSIAPLYAVGVSLGGNALLKWLGEQGEQACHILDGVVAVSVPLDLTVTGRVLDSGFNRFYTRHFLNSLKRKAFEKLDRFHGLFDASAMKECSTLYQFDNLITAPLHGFADTDEYWRLSSSKPWLKYIQIPTLIINARNDPFMPESALPTIDDVPPLVTLEFPEQGGHVGFMSSPFPGRLTWLPKRIIKFFYIQSGSVRS